MHAGPPPKPTDFEQQLSTARCRYTYADAVRKQYMHQMVCALRTPWTSYRDVNQPELPPGTLLCPLLPGKETSAV